VSIQRAVDRGDECDCGGGFGAFDLGEVLRRVPGEEVYELLERQPFCGASRADLGAEPGGV
jgi:hypothetical protein